jgi:uncharacterized cupin superfamily protein
MPGYNVTEGNPRASMRIDSGATNSTSRLGIWMCTPGTFSATEKGDELQTILEGRLTLISEDGSTTDFGPGDSFYTSKGERLTWKITDTVKKVFFTYDTDGNS